MKVPDIKFYKNPLTESRDVMKPAAAFHNLVIIDYKSRNDVTHSAWTNQHFLLQ